MEKPVSYGDKLRVHLSPSKYCKVRLEIFKSPFKHGNFWFDWTSSTIQFSGKLE
jgi:hypothetical protein